ncbi:hypothetical protein IW152_002970 [Coemansia sp. BCRC 34962]|nr:hypothetical protein IW152_002970 [Coemansia sp. BCRC 34962]
MWVCHNLRVVSSLSFYRANTVKIKGDTYEKDAAQYWWWSKPLKKFYPTNYHLAREIHILLDKAGFFAGRTLKALSQAPFDGCAFPQARKLIFTFYPCLAQGGEAPEAAEIGANIRALVGRIKQMAPLLNEIEVVGTSNPANLDLEDRHINSFILQIIPLVTRVVYKASEFNIPLNLPTVNMSRLVHIDVGILGSMEFNYQEQEKSAMHLVRQSAATLQSLTIGLHSLEGLSGLIKETNDNFVFYPQMRVLKLGYHWDLAKFDRMAVAQAVPFPRLRQLTVAGTYPFGDDILFRGNEDTLELLDIELDKNMVAMLKRFSVFTAVSHPRLRCVKTRLSYSPALDHLETASARLRFLLDIAPAAAIREMRGVSFWLPSSLPVFSGYIDIQLLSLPDTRLTLWNTITLVNSLPLLSEIHSPSPIIGTLPAEATMDMLPEFVISNHASTNKTFRCWRVTYEEKWVSKGETVSCVLLLALACPSFDHVLTNSPNRHLFMVHMKEIMNTDIFRPYASRLQPLLL